MKIYSLLFLSVILINGIFHCPNVHAESLSHACHDQAECEFIGDKNCPGSSEITVSKIRYLKIHADVSIVSRIIENFHQDLTKYFDPTPHLQLHSPTKFLSHQAFLI